MVQSVLRDERREPNETREINFSFFANRKASDDLPIRLDIKEKRSKYDKNLPADLALNKVIKKATEVIIAGKDLGLVAITDVGPLSIDIEKNIPKTKMNNKNGIAVVIGNRAYTGDVPSVDFAAFSSFEKYIFWNKTRRFSRHF